MKIRCDVCEKAEAEVLCCADEAVLCRGCDDKVHAANKLSLKHHRLFLLNHHSRSTPSSSSSSSSSYLPLCDICQERNGYIFCLEDRALVCRECDETIHVAGIKSHQRFLIAGVKVSLESSTPNCDQISNNNNNKSSSTSQCSHEEAEMVEATSTAAPLVWPLDDILEIGIDIGLNDFDYYNDLSDMGSSRID